MYVIGDRVAYGIHGVCTVAAIEKRIVDKKPVEYYVLEPLDQQGSSYYVPTQNPHALSKMRPLLNRSELEALLESDEVRQNCWIPDESSRKLRYRELLSGGDRAALISMIGCAYRHKEAQLSQGRKFHLCDENFLRDAQRLLNSEISVVLELEPGRVAEYLRKKLSVV